MVKNLGCLKHRAAAEAMFAMVEARAHHDYVLLARICMAQNVAQVIEVSRITDRDEYVTRPHSHGPATEFLVAVHPELIELLGLAVAFFSHVVLGDGEDRKERRAKDHSGDRSLIFREQVDDGGNEQNGGNQKQTDRDLGFSDVKIPGHFPLAAAWLGKAQHHHGKRFHGETPDYAEGV